MTTWKNETNSKKNWEGSGKTDKEISNETKTDEEICGDEEGKKGKMRQIYRKRKNRGEKGKSTSESKYIKHR